MAINEPSKYRRYQRYFIDLGQLYQKKKVRVYTGIVLSLLTVTFFLFFAIRPTVTTIAGLTKEIKDKKEVAEKLQEKINALNSAQIEYQRAEKELHLVDEALPLNTEVSLLVRQLEALARQYGINIVNLKLNQVPLKGQELIQEGSQATERGADFSLAIAGSYSNLKSFLDSLINLRRLISVNSFTFQTSQEGALVLNLNAQAHYLPPSEKGEKE